MNGYERTRAEIDLSAFKHNVSQVSANVKSGAMLVAVVKADAYGHGAVYMAKAAKEAGVKTFGVAITDEAIELRKNGIDEDIIILGACFCDRIADVINYGFEQTVFTIDMARKLQETAKKLNKTAKIHLKIDTGMGRVGFLPCEKSVSEVAEILAMENVSVKGIFSHLACADHKDKSYSQMQLSRFSSFIESLKSKGCAIPALHISNSGAIIDLPEMNFDAVRAGIMLYGIYPSADVNKTNVKLKPVMSLKAAVTHVKTLAKGECVGYNSRFKAEAETVVATLPLGYADGYRRLLGNGKGRVLIRGQFAETIGDICMDQFMVNVTNIDGVSQGDEAVLIGRQGENEVTVDELANACGTISYEIVCGISKRVLRKYL